MANEAVAFDVSLHAAGHCGIAEQGIPVAERLPYQLPGEVVQGELASGGFLNLLAAERGQDQAVEDVDAELVSRSAPGGV